jgi:hypothetical protein
MQKYIRVLPETVRRPYEECYARIQQKEQDEEGEIMSLLDFAALNPDCSVTTDIAVNA